jgi:hypothetical protein
MAKTTTQKYIVRTDRAGVFFTEIESRNGSEVELRNARRIYYWKGANTCSQIAVDGVANDSQLTVSVPSMTVLGVIEVIPCSDKATACMDAIPEWRI